jgi:hypothetical protein
LKDRLVRFHIDQSPGPRDGRVVRHALLQRHPDELEKHAEDKLYSKEEPPGTISGRSMGKQRVDFIVLSGSVIAGLEVKNVRHWLYPHVDEIRVMLKKCCHTDIVPVLIARRIPYITSEILRASGCVLHQTYNQLYPNADVELAKRARDKNLLGYHDIRIGSEPDGAPSALYL